MPSEWHLIVTRGAVRLRRDWVADPSNPSLRPFGWHSRWGRPGLGAVPEVGIGDVGQSSRSRNRMRWLFASLPWELLGPRLAMLSLTYPGEWREWLPDGRALDGHRRAFLERWRRRWGPPMGVWVKEFQASGRPHLHLYLAIPDEVPTHEYEGLRQRTLLRHRLEREYGRYEGRRRLPAIGGKYGGSFAMWLRTAWSEVVGTQGVVAAHHARGVDVSVSFWTDEVALTKDRTEVAAYLAGESAKWAQKQPPENFRRVGRYYGHVGRGQGFKPVEVDMIVDDAIAYELEKRLARLVRARIIAKRRRYGKTGPMNFDLRRPGSGVQALAVRHEDVPRIMRWCEAAANRKAARRPDDEEFVWGASYAGHSAALLAGLGGEDARFWQVRDDLGKACGCGDAEVCDFCAPPQVLRGWAAGCSCSGSEACIDCVDPKLLQEAPDWPEDRPISRGEERRGGRPSNGIGRGPHR
jgi:hypothetical protein